MTQATQVDGGLIQPDVLRVLIEGLDPRQTATCLGRITCDNQGGQLSCEHEMGMMLTWALPITRRVDVERDRPHLFATETHLRDNGEGTVSVGRECTSRRAYVVGADELQTRKRHVVLATCVLASRSAVSSQLYVLATTSTTRILTDQGLERYRHR